MVGGTTCRPYTTYRYGGGLHVGPILHIGMVGGLHVGPILHIGMVGDYM